MKHIIIALVVISLIIIGYYLFAPQDKSSDTSIDQNQVSNIATTSDQTKEKDEETKKNLEMTVLGQSVEGRDITAFHYGTGEEEIMLIGGIHGGYSWNTVLVAFEAIDYLKANPNVIPSNLKVTIIPVLNPDGLYKVTGTEGRLSPADVPSQLSEAVPGRFNAHNVDLNRNFDCEWQSKGTWQSKTVSGGSKAFSEPESQVIRNYVQENKPTAIVTYYSAAGGVYASECGNGISSETRNIMKQYSSASGYTAYDDFDFYSITGDMVNWFAKNNIPAISILLTNHQDTEWSKNQKGILALLKYYSQ